MGSAWRAACSWLLLLGACQGTIGQSAGRGGAGGAALERTYAPAGLRLLTPAQFQNSLQDLVGPEVAVSAVGQWRSSIAAAQGGVSLATVEQYESEARAVAERVFGDDVRREALVGCAPTGEDGDPCARGFLSSIGRLAWRRALTDEELDRFAGLARDLSASLGDPWRGLELAFTGLVQSPKFLYRTELGEPDPERPDRLRFTSLEMASRLSYLLWNTAPDAVLLDAAEEDALATPDGLRREVRRLLESPRANEGLLQLYTDWLDLDALEVLEKDAERLPRFTPTIGLAMREQLQRTIEAVALGPGGSHLDLLDTRETFVNAELAGLYELPGTFGDDFVAVTLPADGPRAGLLTFAGLLAEHAGEADTSPTLRGKFVRNALLCQDIPPPPPGVVTVVPEPAPGELVTTRELLERHRDEPTCASCHKFMDPIGLSLETFDALGQYRTTQNGLPIDTTGDVDGVPFADGRELGRVLRDDPGVIACLAETVYRFATGHVETEGERPAVDEIAEAVSSGAVRDLVEALATSDAFRYAAPPAPEEASP